MVLTARGHIYTGISTDVEKRIKTHNAGRGSKALRGQLPVTLICAAGPTTLSKALSIEKRMKKLNRVQKTYLLALIDHQLGLQDS